VVLEVAEEQVVVVVVVHMEETIRFRYVQSMSLSE
jgi:hypothetical protein